jgi:hypothetical protein
MNDASRTTDEEDGLFEDPPGFFRLSIPPGEVLAEELGACGLT